MKHIKKFNEELWMKDKIFDFLKKGKDEEEGEEILIEIEGFYLNPLKKEDIEVIYKPGSNRPSYNFRADGKDISIGYNGDEINIHQSKNEDGDYRLVKLDVTQSLCNKIYNKVKKILGIK